MASSNISSAFNGIYWEQTGNGVPNHIAVEGTEYMDLDTFIKYVNTNGIADWMEMGGSGPSTDIYISGMSFNNSNYNLVLNRNDGVNFIQNLGILASDMTVTGGTYNSSTGTATFVNNSGGTFAVTGFITGFTDSYTTGATLSGNAITFDNSTLGPNYYSVNLLPILSPKFDKSGGTINGSVIANSFIKSGGTANQFLKADGSSDSTIYQSFISSGLTTDYYRGDKTFQPLTTGVVSEVTNKHYVTDLDLVHLSGLSGINTGDNAVNTTSNAYADAKVQDVIVDGVSGIAPSQNVVYDKLLLKQNLPTGFISGLPLSIKPLDNTKAIIGNGAYAITDFSVLSAITVQLVSITTPIEFSPQFLLTNPASYVALDINQNVIQSSSPFTNEDRRTLALVGAVIHSNNININTTNEIKAPIVAPTNQLHDMIKAVGSLNLEGNIYSPNGANLQLNKSAGVIWGLGINAADFYNPHVLSVSAQTAFNFNYRLRNSFQYSGTTSIDPNNYDNGGVLSVVPNNRFTIQRINLFQSGLSILQYGQNVYQSIDEAKVGVSSENFVTEQNIGDNAIFRSYLILKKGITNLTTAVSSNEAFFLPVDKFGNVVGGGSLSTLQSAYDNSTTPEIVTNLSLGPLSIRNGAGTADINTRLFEGLSSGGTVTSFITAAGGFSGASVSATTYYNLPKDIFVTGGTFNTTGGTTTFTNNSGGTFQVTGFTTSGIIAGKENKSEKGQPSGYAPLDINGKVPLLNINDALLGNVNYQGLWSQNTNTPNLTVVEAKGHYYICSGLTQATVFGLVFNTGDWIISDGVAWGKVDNTDAVSTVFGRTGNILAVSGDYNTNLVTETTNKNYQTDNQKLYNDATSSIQTQLNSKQPLISNPVTGTGVSGQVSFWNGTNSQSGDNALFWNNTNKTLGIGTTNHVGGFNVNIGTTNTYSLATQDDNSISITNAGTGVGAPTFVSKTTTNGLRFISGTNDVNSVFDMNFDVRRTDNTDFTGFTTSAFRFTRGGTTRLMDILRDGKVGIGTTIAPIAKLQVVDTNGGFFFDGSNVTYNRIKSTGVASTTGKDMLFTAQSGGTNPDLYLMSDSTVGIGTFTPVGKLNVFTSLSALTLDIVNQQNGSISLANNSGSVTAPAIAGKSDNHIGLQFIGATNETNSQPDMLFNVRKNNNTDFSGFTTSAFRFSRFGTTLIDVLRNGNTTFNGSVFAPTASAGTNNTQVATTAFVTANAVGGTGTANFISKWSGLNTQTNANIFDNGTNIGLGTSTSFPGYVTIIGGSSVLPGLAVQNGSAQGSIRIGADVNTTTLTSGVRKYAVITTPPISGTTPILIMASDNNTVGENLLHLGGRVASGLGGATKILLTTAISNSSTTSVSRIEIDDKVTINTGLSGIPITLAGMANGSITMTNGGGITAVPLIIGRSNDSIGLFLQAGSNNVNPLPDMGFDVRKNDNTDFTIFNTPAFRFSRFGTVLMDINRDGNTIIGPTTGQTWLNSSTAYGTAKLNLSSVGGVRLLEVNREDTAITSGITGGVSLALSTVPFGNGTGGAFGSNMLGYMRNPLESFGIRAATVPLSDTGTEPIIKLEANGSTTNGFAGILPVATRPILGVYNYSTSLFRVMANGAIGAGVGLTTPNYNLHVNSNATSNYLQLTTSNTGIANTDGFVLGVATSSEIQFINRENTPITFHTNNTEKWRTHASGGLSVGNTTDLGAGTINATGQVQASQFKLSALNTAPATATSAGVLGEIRIVNGFIYVCVATNVWQRAALVTF